MTSTRCCRDQDALVRQVGRDKTVKTLEDDHGKLELYSLSDGQWRLCSTGVMCRTFWYRNNVILTKSILQMHKTYIPVFNLYIS